jgi:hypothetical protein
MMHPLTIFLAEFHFDETLSIGDALVGLGTLGLAGVTGLLAWQTRKEAEASKANIKLTRAGIEAQDMPYVIAVPNPDQIRDLDGTTNSTFMWWGMHDGQFLTLQLRLWNMGRGPAIVRDIRLEVEGEEWLAANQDEMVIAPEGVRDVTIAVDRAEPPTSTHLGVLRIYYAHGSGTVHMTRSRAGVTNGGVRCSSFSRSLADGEERNLLADW